MLPCCLFLWGQVSQRDIMNCVHRFAVHGRMFLYSLHYISFCKWKCDSSNTKTKSQIGDSWSLQGLSLHLYYWKAVDLWHTSSQDTEEFPSTPSVYPCFASRVHYCNVRAWILTTLHLFLFSFLLCSFESFSKQSNCCFWTHTPLTHSILLVSHSSRELEKPQ